MPSIRYNYPRLAHARAEKERLRLVRARAEKERIRRENRERRDLQQGQQRQQQQPQQRQQHQQHQPAAAPSSPSPNYPHLARVRERLRREAKGRRAEALFRDIQQRRQQQQHQQHLGASSVVKEGVVGFLTYVLRRYADKRWRTFRTNIHMFEATFKLKKNAPHHLLLVDAVAALITVSTHLIFLRKRTAV